MISEGQTLESTIIEIVELQLGRAPVRATDRFVDNLEADSFDLMNVVAIVEERFELAITEQQAAELETVADLVTLARSVLPPSP